MSVLSRLEQREPPTAHGQGRPPNTAEETRPNAEGHALPDSVLAVFWEGLKNRDRKKRCHQAWGQGVGMKGGGALPGLEALGWKASECYALRLHCDQSDCMWSEPQYSYCDP